MPTVDIGTLRARIAMDASQFSQAIGESQTQTAELANSAKTLGNRIRVLENEIRKGGDETGELNAELTKLRAEFTKVNADLVVSRETTRRLTREMRQSGRAARRTGRDFRQAGRDVTAANTRFRDFATTANALRLGLAGAFVGATAGLVRVSNQVQETVRDFRALAGEASRIGISPDRLFALKTVLDQEGDEVGLAINELGLRLAEFDQLGTGAFQNITSVFPDLRIQAGDLEQSFVAILSRIQQLQQAGQFELASFLGDEAFGGGDFERINLALSQLPDDFAEVLRRQLERQSITGEDIEALSDLGRTFNELQASITEQLGSLVAANRDNLERIVAQVTRLANIAFSAGGDVSRFGVSGGLQFQFLRQFQGFSDRLARETLAAPVRTLLRGLGDEGVNVSRLLADLESGNAESIQSVREVAEEWRRLIDEVRPALALARELELDLPDALREVGVVTEARRRLEQGQLPLNLFGLQGLRDIAGALAELTKDTTAARASLEGLAEVTREFEAQLNAATETSARLEAVLANPELYSEAYRRLLLAERVRDARQEELDAVRRRVELEVLPSRALTAVQEAARQARREQEDLALALGGAQGLSGLRERVQAAQDVRDAARETLAAREKEARDARLSEGTRLGASETRLRNAREELRLAEEGLEAANRASRLGAGASLLPGGIAGAAGGRGISAIYRARLQRQLAERVASSVLLRSSQAGFARRIFRQQNEQVAREFRRATRSRFEAGGGIAGAVGGGLSGALFFDADRAAEAVRAARAELFNAQVQQKNLTEATEEEAAERARVLAEAQKQVRLAEQEVANAERLRDLRTQSYEAAVRELILAEESRDASREEAQAIEQRLRNQLLGSPELLSFQQRELAALTEIENLQAAIAEAEAGGLLAAYDRAQQEERRRDVLREQLDALLAQATLATAPPQITALRDTISAARMEGLQLNAVLQDPAAYESLIRQEHAYNMQLAAQRKILAAIRERVTGEQAAAQAAQEAAEAERLATLEFQRLAREEDNIRNNIARQFTDAIVEAKSLADSIREIGKELLKLALNTQLRNLFANIGFGSRGRSGLLGLGGVFGFLQEGGPALAGRPYVVGEQGPELFIPRTSGTVVPNGQGFLSGGLSVTVNGVQDPDTVVAVVRNEVPRALEGALTRRLQGEAPTFFGG